MNSIIEKLKAGASQIQKTTWPGTDVTVGLRPLTEQDYLDASLATDRLYKKADIAVGMHNISDYNAEKDTHRLWRALVDPDTGERLTSSLEDFRRLLTSGVRGILIEKLNALDEEVNPNPYEMTDEEFDELYFSLKKNCEKIIGNVSNTSTLRRLVRSLVADLSDLPTDNGSTS